MRDVVLRSYARFRGQTEYSLGPPYVTPRAKEKPVVKGGSIRAHRRFQLLRRLSVRDGTVAAADRPVSYMKDWSLKRVLALAERWGWKVEFNDREQARLEQGSPL